MILLSKERAGFILSEGNWTISREVVTVRSSGGAIEPGTLLMLSPDGDYIYYNSSTISGPKFPVVILIQPLQPASSNRPALICARMAEVLESRLLRYNDAAKYYLSKQQIIVR